MHTNLEVSVRQSDAVQSVIDVLASWRIDTHHVHPTQIKSIGLLVFWNGKFVAGGWEAVVCGLAELSNFDVMFKENGVCLCPVFANVSDHSHEVTERVC